MFGASPHCVSCEKAVYFAEQIKFKHDYYHKACFKCDKCNKVLENVSLAHDTSDGKKYCQPCYSKVLGPKGYGYGSGVMQPVSKDSLNRLKEEPHKKQPESVKQTEKPKEKYSEKRETRTTGISFGNGGTTCPICHKQVYFAEMIKALGNSYHKTCFKCSDCGRTIATAADALDSEGQVYCKACYGKHFGPKGIGFGNALNDTGISRSALDI